jgi:phosphopantothenoylcysteine decarboxylase/phosphopantothenate--cysteine ligase
MQALKGSRVLITAGPTYEPIDPVRFIGNHSTGKMGYAIANALADAGAQVSLISGPSSLTTQHPNITLIKVMTADQMHQAVLREFPDCRIAIFSAAVADYKPALAATQKIKKTGDTLTLELVKNVDIAAEAGKVKKANQFLVGFALETNQEEENARKKLLSKNLDMIVLNSLNDAGAAFGHDTNLIRILDRHGIQEYPLKSKQEVAHDIAAAIVKRLR